MPDITFANGIGTAVDIFKQHTQATYMIIRHMTKQAFVKISRENTIEVLDISLKKIIFINVIDELSTRKHIFLN